MVIVELLNNPGNSIFPYSTGCISLFFLAIWWYRQKDRVFGLFALVLMLWTAGFGFHLAGLSSARLYPLLPAAWAGSMAVLAFQTAGKPVDSFPRIFIGTCCALIVFGDMPELPLSRVIPPLLGLLVLSLIWTTQGVAQGSTRQANPRVILVLLSLNLLAYPTSASLLYWEVASLLYIAIALIITHRFAIALSEWEKLNSILQERVDIEHRKIDEQYNKLIEVERNNAAMKERQRIFQDIHDDIGARLLTIVHMSETEEDQSLARKALQELRDIVSINSRSQLSLADAMADICTQSLHTLENAGFTLNWQQDIDIPDSPLSESFFIELKKAIRQAVALWIASADAGELIVRVFRSANELQISFANLGKPCINTILENFQHSLVRHGGHISLDQDLVLMVPLHSEPDTQLTDIAV